MFNLLVLFKDGTELRKRVKRFSDLSHDGSPFYYYEEFHDEHGRGKCFKRNDIICFELNCIDNLIKALP